MIVLTKIYSNSYMDSEDDMDNLSEHRNNSRHVHYADSMTSSSNSESGELDKYLDEAIDDDDDEDVAMNQFQGKSNEVSKRHSLIYLFKFFYSSFNFLPFLPFRTNN